MHSFPHLELHFESKSDLVDLLTGVCTSDEQSLLSDLCVAQTRTWTAEVALGTARITRQGGSAKYCKHLVAQHMLAKLLPEVKTWRDGMWG